MDLFKIIYIPTDVAVLKKDNFLILAYKENLYIKIEIPKEASIKKEKSYLFLFFKKEKKNSLKTFGIIFQNILIGLKRAYVSRLILKGIGYRIALAEKKGNLEMKLGYSHPVNHLIKTSFISPQVFKSTMLELKSPFKDILNKEASTISFFKKPDAYKGKGFLKKGQILKLKVGKKS